MRASAVVAAGALLLSVTACGGNDPHHRVLGPGAATTPAASASPAASWETAPPDSPTALLDQRARAVLDHDQEAFLAPVERSDPSFFATQWRLYLDLQRLPLSALSFGEAADGRATRSLTLGRPGASFDQEQVVGPAGFAVTGTPGRLLVVPAKDEPATDPWDLTTIQVAPATAPSWSPTARTPGGPTPCC